MTILFYVLTAILVGSIGYAWGKSRGIDAARRNDAEMQPTAAQDYARMPGFLRRMMDRPDECLDPTKAYGNWVDSIPKAPEPLPLEWQDDTAIYRGAGCPIKCERPGALT